MKPTQERLQDLETKVLEIQEEINGLNSYLARENSLIGYYKYKGPWNSTQITYFHFSDSRDECVLEGCSFKTDKGAGRRKVLSLSLASTHVDRLTDMEKITREQFLSEIETMDITLIDSMLWEFTSKRVKENA